MKKYIKSILITLSILALPISVLAVNISVPSAPGSNYVLLSNSAGSYNPVATSSLGITGGGGSGTVTSVGATVPTGLSISGSPITTSGTLAFTLTSGYVIPLIASTTQWSNAFASTSALSGTSPIVYNIGTGAISCPTCNTSASNVTSVFGRTGVVTAQSGDYTSAQITELTNLFFTNARAIAATLTGYTSGAGTISASDSILSAIQKLNGNISALVTGVSSVSNSDGTLTISPTTGSVTASRAAITGDVAIAGASNSSVLATVNSNVGSFTNANITVNGKGLITAASNGSPSSSFATTSINGFATTTFQFNVGTSGADFNIATSTSAVTFNLPTASASNRGALSSTDWSTFNGKGSVSSVAMTTPTGLSISGSPITTSGTLALSLTAGFNIPLTASTTQWSNLVNASTTLPYVNNTTDTTLTRSGSIPYTLGINLANADTWTGTHTFSNAIAALFTGKVGIGSSTPNYALVVASSTNNALNMKYDPNATTTEGQIMAGGSVPGRFILKDQTGTGCTSITSQAGVLTAAVITCPN